MTPEGNKMIITEDGTKEIEEVKKEVKVEMGQEGEQTVATVTIETTKNGETTSETKTFKGTKEEVEAQLESFKEAQIEVESDGMKVIKEIKEEMEETNG